RSLRRSRRNCWTRRRSCRRTTRRCRWTSTCDPRRRPCCTSVDLPRLASTCAKEASAMTASPTNPAPVSEWQAKDVKHLLQIWKDLRPDSEEDAVERKFEGQLLTAEQAGAVFERWILEAFRLSGAVGHYAFRV